MNKDLKEKAIRVKGGKDYVEVKHRVEYFNDNYKDGSIETELLNVMDMMCIIPEEKQPLFIVRAKVSVGDGRIFTGLSQARLGGAGANKEAALENAETSAVGRALAFMGIGVIDGIASVDELAKANVNLTDDDF